MYYYILPKNNSNLDISFFYNVNNSKDPIISHTLIQSLNKMNMHIQKYNKNDIHEIFKIINVSEYNFTNVLDIAFLRHIENNNQTYYELYEIIVSHSICNSSDINVGLRMLYVSNHLQMKPNDTTNMTNVISFNNMELSSSNSYDFMFFECSDDDNNIQINKLIIALYYICMCQNKYGTTIIKINTTYHKQIIDILYIFSNLFDKVCLIKTMLTSVLNNEKYILCKKYTCENTSEYISIIKPIAINILNMPTISLNISSILNNPIPNIFLNKIEEFNAIYGQQQLELYDQIINILNNKNKIDKLELLKKGNMQKCELWNEKMILL